MLTDRAENRKHFVHLADSVLVPAAKRACTRHEMPDRYACQVQPKLDHDPLVMVSVSHFAPVPTNQNPAGCLRFQSDLETGEVIVSVSLGRSGEHLFERTNPDREELGRYPYKSLRASEVEDYVQSLVELVLKT